MSKRPCIEEAVGKTLTEFNQSHGEEPYRAVERTKW